MNIQTTSELCPSLPSWFGEVTVIARYLRHLGVLSAISEQARFARRRFGHYESIDFVAALIGYAISGERTLEAFYERVQPFAQTFMALFGRERPPHRSTLSRFLAALDQALVEALRTLFLEDLLARPLEREKDPWQRRFTQADLPLPIRILGSAKFRSDIAGRNRWVAEVLKWLETGEECNSSSKQISCFHGARQELPNTRQKVKFPGRFVEFRSRRSSLL